MSEYIYATNGEPVANFEGNISLARKKIVRCRDCKFCMAYMAGTYCDYMAHAIKPDGFCAWAKRKEID